MAKNTIDFDQLLSVNFDAELARRNMLDFVQYVKPNYRANWHHELLCSYIDRFISGDIQRLAVFLPPQHGKSEIVSRCLPAFCLGKNPTAKIVGAAYSAHLANSFNRDAQRIIESDLYRHVFPDTRISGQTRDSEIVGRWKRTSDEVEVIGHGGFFKTVGVGGSLTGTPADFAIIDDPVKDAVEAMSPTYQERNWNWYTDVLSTRLHNDSRVLITQTRWDVNDLSGKILKQMEDGGEKWEVLLLPAVMTANGHPDDPREIGEALWPEKHNIEKLLNMRKKSIRTFEALYQQNPKPVQAGGEFWKGFNPEKHTGNFPYIPGEPIHISLDNNVNPYVTCSVWQLQNKKRVTQVHEIASKDPNNNAVKAAIQLGEWLARVGHENVIYVYGDPSASARSTIDPNNLSFFDKYIDVLKQLGHKIIDRVKKSMPDIRMSANFINEVYEHELGGFSIRINSTCGVSIEDYYTVKEDDEGKMLKIKRKDPGTNIQYEPYGHFSDTKRYFIITLLAAEFDKWKSPQNRYVIVRK